MKKFLTIIIVLVTCFCMTACNSCNSSYDYSADANHVTKNQFEKAISFDDKNFTMNIVTNSAAGIATSEENYYQLANQTAYSENVFKSDNSIDYTGIVAEDDNTISIYYGTKGSDNKITWTLQTNVSKEKYSESYYYCDRHSLISLISGFNFFDFIYSHEDHVYTGTVTHSSLTMNVKLKFSNKNLVDVELTNDDGSTAIIGFTGYGKTQITNWNGLEKIATSLNG